MNQENVFRWTIMAPVVASGWMLAATLGMLEYVAINDACPEGKTISGMCRAGWYPWAETAVLGATGALAALLAVMMAHAIAPHHKMRVAVVSLGCTASVALGVGWEMGTWAPLIGAVVAGCAALAHLVRIVKRRG